MSHDSRSIHHISPIQHILAHISSPPHILTLLYTVYTPHFHAHPTRNNEQTSSTKQTHSPHRPIAHRTKMQLQKWCLLVVWWVSALRAADEDPSGGGSVPPAPLGGGEKKKKKAAAAAAAVAAAAATAVGGAAPAEVDASVKAKVGQIREATGKALQQIFSRWEVEQFPNFLRSVAMSQTSWELLKVKYQLKILKAMMASDPSSNGAAKVKFVIGFMGSSVTAGHDTNFNYTFSEITQRLMAPAFAASGIDLEVKNGAMGNNPCLPYDACVRTFAGPEADIVHWEQSFNCFGTDHNKKVEFEQFIRQSMALASQPVVVFSTSSTPNWPAADCKDKDPKEKPSKKAEDEKLLKLLETDPSKIPLENKRDEHHWSALLSMFQAYKMAGIQMWHHDHYRWRE